MMMKRLMCLQESNRFQKDETSIETGLWLASVNKSRDTNDLIGMKKERHTVLVLKHSLSTYQIDIEWISIGIINVSNKRKQQR